MRRHFRRNHLNPAATAAARPARHPMLSFASSAQCVGIRAAQSGSLLTSTSLNSPPHAERHPLSAKRSLFSTTASLTGQASLVDKHAGTRPQNALLNSWLRRASKTGKNFTLNSSADDGAPSQVAVHPVFLARLPLFSRPASRRLLSFLSFDNPSMVPESPHMPPLLVFVREQKRLRPDKVLIIQASALPLNHMQKRAVGDFFEAYGLDAVLLVEYCGLNPMGGKAKAGCPKQNLQQTLDCLTSEGFSVSVFEEFASPVAATPVAPGGSRKLRLLTQIISPSSPLYLPAHMPLYEGEIGAHTPDSQPVFSLYYSPSAGYACGEIDVPQRTLRVEGGLTAEGVEMRIRSASGGMPQGELYVHQIPALGSRGDGTTRLARRLFPSLRKIYLRDYSSPSAFHRAVLRHLTASLQLPHSEFTIRSHLDYFSPSLAIPEPAAAPSDLGVMPSLAAPSSLPPRSSPNPPSTQPPGPENRAAAGGPAGSAGEGALQSFENRPEPAFAGSAQSSTPFTAKLHRHRPHPLYVSTASQLGLLTSAARQGNIVASTSSVLVPPLHLAALPAGAPVTAARFLQRLLLFPPPHSVADAIQSILRQLLRLGRTDSRLSSAFMKPFPGSNGEEAAPPGASSLSGDGGPGASCGASPPSTKNALESTAESRGPQLPPRIFYGAEPGIGRPAGGVVAGAGERAAEGREKVAGEGGDPPLLLVPAVRVMDAGKLVQVISSRSANRRFFLELLTLLAPTRYCLRRYPPSLLKPLLTVLQHETQQQVSQDRFLEGVEKAICLIEQVLLLEEEEQEEAAESAALAAIAAAEQMSRLAAATDVHVGTTADADISGWGQPTPSGDPQTLGGSDGQEDPSPAQAASAAAAVARAVAEAAAAREAAAQAASRALATVAGGHATSSSTRGLLPLLDDYFRRMERFRGHIQPFCVPYAHAVVAAAVDDLLIAIFEDFAGIESMPPLRPVCALEDFLDSADSAPSAGRPRAGLSKVKSTTLLTARDLVDLFIAVEKLQAPAKASSSSSPPPRIASLLQMHGERIRIPPSALLSSIEALQRQRLAPAFPSAGLGRAGSSGAARQLGDAEWPRLLGALQKRLWGDTLNESVYLKKGKPPLEPLKAASRNGRRKSAGKASPSAALAAENEDLYSAENGLNSYSEDGAGAWSESLDDDLGHRAASALAADFALEDDPAGAGGGIASGIPPDAASADAAAELEARHARSQVESGVRSTTSQWSKTPEHPRDRHGHQIASGWTTPRVAASVRAYTTAKNFAAAAVEKRLRQLSKDLQPLLPEILLASHLIIILQSLSQHAAFAATQGWQLPQLLDPTAKAALKVDTLTPYYMPRPNARTLALQRLRQQAELAAAAQTAPSAQHARLESGQWTREQRAQNVGKGPSPAEPSRGDAPRGLTGHAVLQDPPFPQGEASKDDAVVSYSFGMHGLFVLTGENMAGKSTFCRSVLALVVLANAGLFCPCGPETVVPRYGAFLSSSYMAHDSPLENKSFFFEELSQLHSILAQARGYNGGNAPPTEAGHLTSSTEKVSLENAATPFVIVDEPCKGTAPKWGAGFVGAALELLCRGRTHGVLSTHLHNELTRLPLDLPANVRFKRMGVRKTSQPASADARSAVGGGLETPGGGLQTPPEESGSGGSVEGGTAAASESLQRIHAHHLGAQADRVYTYELLDGVCRDSNAMLTAWKVGMPPGIITRANELQAHLDAPELGFTAPHVALASQENGESPSLMLKTRPGTVRARRDGEHQAPSVQTQTTAFAATPGRPAAPSGSGADAGDGGFHTAQEATAVVTEGELTDDSVIERSPETPAEEGSEEEQTDTGAGADSGRPRELLDTLERSESLVHAFASSAMALNGLLDRLRLTLIETTQQVACAEQVRITPGASRKATERSAHELRPSADKTARNSAAAASSVARAAPQVLQLPSLSRRLAAPPPWQDGAACVYVLVAPCTVARKVHRLAFLESGVSAIGADYSEARSEHALADLGGFCANVYVGETERLETRLRTHSRSPLWAHARVLAVRVRGKGEARDIETALIRRLKEEKGVVLMSLKDGNRKAVGAGLNQDF
ncbi:hypothetical protein BESB_039610 [Besnoitia besnoiti]|uniref:DNA mismatch repair proteins mutS family domain-containing protein n=1 Tax=Besnoitia besnoiti TaxID=94643 RepID=A0A2A9MNK4_BESBE|nr:hypothetical protein BESB_039610 [Besnoitia besnoiti]PFH37503.1 hypothetical protein BESB_039610 [Besnoitia besnoiti]